MPAPVQHSVVLKDGYRYAVPIGAVQEVLRAERLLPFPAEVAGFLGYVELRGDLCPVLDLSALLASQIKPAPGGPSLLLVLRHEATLFALTIDRYSQTVLLEGLPEAGNERVLDHVEPQNGEALYRLDARVLAQAVSAQLKLLPRSPASQAEGLSPTDEPEVDMICFRLGSLQFALPVSDLVEVIEGNTVEPLFKTDPFLRGLINLRGQIIACIDLSQAVGLPPRVLDERNQFLLLQNGERDLALCVDAVSRKRKFPARAVAEVAGLFPGELAEYLAGIVEEDGERTLVLAGASIFLSRHLVAYQEGM